MHMLITANKRLSRWGEKNPCWILQLRSLGTHLAAPSFLPLPLSLRNLSLLGSHLLALLPPQFFFMPPLLW